MKKIYKILLLTAVVQGSVTVANAQQGNYLNFDGVNDYIQIADDPSLQLTHVFTVESWIRPTSSVGDLGIVSKNDDDGFIIWINNGRNILARIGGVGFGSTVDTVALNNWHHVALTYNFGLASIYIDGVLVDTMNSDLQAVTDTIGLKIGNWTGPLFRFFAGDMDEVRIWNIARTAAEINANMNNELLGNEPGLAAYYNFNQGTPCSSNIAETTLIDGTSLNNTGVLTSFDLTGTLTDSCESNWNGPIITSIVDNIKDDNLTLYPNPTREHVTIDLGAIKDAQISILNITGQEVYRLNNVTKTQVKISLAEFDSGVYFVRIQNGNQQTSMTLIKQ